MAVHQKLEWCLSGLRTVLLELLLEFDEGGCGLEDGVLVGPATLMKSSYQKRYENSLA